MNRITRRFLALLLLTWLGVAPADEIRPALLELAERDSGRIDVTWKVPMRGAMKLSLQPVLPEFSTTPIASCPRTRESWLGGGSPY